MASLDELLEETMIFAAARGEGREPLRDPEEIWFEPPPRPAKDGESPPTVPLWHWFWSPAQPHVIRELTCRARAYDFARMMVCTKLSFENLMVFPIGHDGLPLPLEPAFLVRSYFLDHGRIDADQNPMYPLEADVDSSLLLVFAYDFSTGTAQPIDDERLDSPDFMPEPGATPDVPAAGPGETATGTADGLRVVVFASLVCCKERFDFAPGGLLGAGRFYPHLMVMANLAVDQIFGEVHYKRPEFTTSAEPLDEHHLHHMDPRIGSLFATDSNHPIKRDLPVAGPVLPSPIWSDLFDHIEVDPVGLRHVVVRDLPRGIVDGAVKVVDDGLLPTLGEWLLGIDPYETRSFEVVARQGTFDNVHLAPRMKIPDIPDLPGEQSPRKIVMAPFCEHDCLHTHWRWGQENTNRFDMGWGPDGGGRFFGLPYAAAGAPMVAHNQSLEIHVGPNSFEYRAWARGATPSAPLRSGTFTVINHHGSAYSLTVSAFKMGLAQLVVSANSPVGSPVVPNTVPGMYWNQRFFGYKSLLSGTVVYERLVYTSNGLDITRANIRSRTEPWVPPPLRAGP